MGFLLDGFLCFLGLWASWVVACFRLSWFRCFSVSVFDLRAFSWLVAVHLVVCFVGLGLLFMWVGVIWILGALI